MKKLLLLATVFCNVMPLQGDICFRNNSKSKVDFEVLYSALRTCRNEKGLSLQPDKGYCSKAACKTKKIFASLRNNDNSVKARFSVIGDSRSTNLLGETEESLTFEFSEDEITVVKHGPRTGVKSIETYKWGHTE